MKTTCYACRGEKWDYDPRDPRDPVEGNKMRSRVPCLVCEGTGKMHPVAIKSHLKWCAEEYAE